MSDEPTQPAMPFGADTLIIPFVIQRQPKPEPDEPARPRPDRDVED